MKHLTILVPNGNRNLSSIASIIGTYDVFLTANKYWKAATKKELFKIDLAGTGETTEYAGGVFSLRSLVDISAIRKTDLIIVPSTSIRSYEEAAEHNLPILKWLSKQYSKGAEVASICSGAFLLASSGLLDGKSCSTHWKDADTFRATFPNVTVEPDKLITDEHGIYTNGGGYSFLNLLMYLVEKWFDRPTAIFCSKIFQIEIDRQSQSSFVIFNGQKLHGDEMVKEAQTYIEQSVTEKISVGTLSTRFAVGRRNFDRRFIKATGNTPVQYAQRVKIESAKKAFETTRKNINEVMYDVGYSDVKAFREVFKKITGISPIDYRSKYNKELVNEK